MDEETSALEIVVMFIMSIITVGILIGAVLMSYRYDLFG